MIGNPEIDLHAIEQFVGYGNPAALVVFVGIEERLSDYDQRLRSLEVRSTFEPIMDVALAHTAGLAHDPRLFDPDHVVCQRTWRPMCDLMLRLDNLESNCQARNQYQANHLGRADGNSLLMELLPYPHASARNWWYEDLHPEWATRFEYETAMLPLRIPMLGQQLAGHPRTLIVCYGASHWDSYRALMQGYQEHLTPEQQAAPINWVVHAALSAETAIVGETRIVLANHFTRQPLSSNWALAPFADLCLQ
jgi:hypothetical protein